MTWRRPQPPTIRQYRRSDDPEVWALASLASPSTTDPPLPLPAATTPPPEFPELADISGTFLHPGGDFLVAELDGDVVGTIGLRRSEHGGADVVWLLVHPAARRRGVGSALLEAVEWRAIGLGIRRLNLDVENSEKDAIAFYLASGFQGLDPEEDSEGRWSVNFFSKSLKVV